jgi:predicted TIM-barrel fold metal-dependent hydrolase
LTAGVIVAIGFYGAELEVGWGSAGGWEAFGPQRLMYGSDWPVCQLAAPYGAVADTALQWAASRLSNSEQNAFWSGNAVRAYGLTLPTSPHQ